MEMDGYIMELPFIYLNRILIKHHLLINIILTKHNHMVSINFILELMLLHKQVFVIGNILLLHFMHTIFLRTEQHLYINTT
jgi:hypothetical protein